ncbi:hypothetical protein Vretimale_3719 [Volvox reticuliferus]|uniref:Uncharacterized protein n=1 Tax=Volvox reticuliferus TaxID=1737510 RepID=A0A8J4FG22_9CHLO|nr:hypothetical protein Vretifemale_1331 [Volvox reticuliferus]GIL98337.1 hypothetical protein Vretimale_3719 [Volvox reticuliferus]
MARLKPGKLLLPTLDTGPVPLVSIREQARKQLLEVIDSRRGKKALILDPAITGPLSLLDTALTDVLTEHGVVRLLYLEPGKRLDDPSYNATEQRLSDVPTIMYLVRPSIANAQALATQVKSRPKSARQTVALFFVPRRTIACERILEEEGVLGDFAEIGEYCLDMVPYDDDVISLELDTAFYDCICDGDSTPLYYTAAAITRLQALFGLIPRVQGKGPAATAVRDMCFRMRRESSGLLTVPPLAAGGSCFSAGVGPAVGGFSSGRIDRLILLDREVDVITPMMTQITFEGLIDEITGIRHGSVPLQPADKRVGEPGDSHGAAGSRGSIGRTYLNSTDPFYREFRDLPFHVATQRLQQYAREARREYSELGNKDIRELKNFVRGLPKLTMLDRLSDVATPPADQVKQQRFHDRLNQEQAIVEGYEPEASVAFIEELMYRGADLVDVLRLLVLLNAVGGGLARRQLDSLRMEILHTYGHQHLLTLNALEKSGLLRASLGAKGQFSAVRKALQLIVPEQDVPAGAATPDAPSDVSCLYKGYAPLSIRLVETALRSSWGPLQEVIGHLPGNHFDVLQTVDSNGMPVEKPVKATLSGSSGLAASPGLGPAASGGTGGSGGGGAAASGSLQGPASQSAGPVAASGVGIGGGPLQAETVLVVFIGGVTFAEISALRFLSSRPEWPYRFVVLTTKIINGRTLLQTFVDPLANDFPGC